MLDKSKGREGESLIEYKEARVKCGDLVEVGSEEFTRKSRGKCCDIKS